MNARDKPENILSGVLKGNVRAVARMMSLAESRYPAARDVVREVYGHTGRAHIVGLTGVPGSGKSTMVSALTRVFRLSGKRVGIVAVDPSSPFSGGAILGDRVRMGALTTDEGVFVRSIATRGALGGLARAALDAADVLDAAGYDIVLIETVGVGQDEVDIAGAAHTIVVVSAPGLGDGVQAIKAGVLEIADIHAVSKCDKPEAADTAADLRAMLHLGLQGRERYGWAVPIVPTSSESGEGIDALARSIFEHETHLNESGEWPVRRRKIAETRILKSAEDLVRDVLEKGREEHLSDLIDQASSRRIDPRSAASRLIRGVNLDL